jgi:tRNA threonylcarbamoyladenosine biosynthesis protein TsaE
MTRPDRELAAARLPDGRELTVRTADRDDAATVLALTHEAFTARPVVGPPAEALSDDLDAVRDRLAAGTIYLAEIDEEPVGTATLIALEGRPLLCRIGVVPSARGLGVATFLLEVIGEHRVGLGEAEIVMLVRRDHPELVAGWHRVGFRDEGVRDGHVLLCRPLPVVVEAPDADAMRALGRRLARVLHRGDLIVASGDLGAGKTTFTQGLGAGLDVGGPVISPTFVLSRVHRSRNGGPGLVHVDAYRLNSFAELEDLDLEASLGDSVTLVEWGSGVAEALTRDRIELDIRRGIDPDDDTRWVSVTPLGDRWDRAAVAAALKEES